MQRGLRQRERWCSLFFQQCRYAAERADGMREAQALRQARRCASRVRRAQAVRRRRRWRHQPPIALIPSAAPALRRRPRFAALAPVCRSSAFCCARYAQDAVSSSAEVNIAPPRAATAAQPPPCAVARMRSSSLMSARHTRVREQLIAAAVAAMLPATCPAEPVAESMRRWRC